METPAPPVRFHWRRVPGTLALALTNLIAAALVVFSTTFEVAPVTVKAAGVAPAWVWGVLFGISGAFLALSVVTRRWTHLNIGSALSLFLWTFMLSQVLLGWLTGHFTLSPVAVALMFWMFAGQATMLFAPLWARGRGYE